MVEGSQWRILQLWLFLTLPSSQTTRLEHYDGNWKSFSWIPHLPNFAHMVWWSTALWTARTTRRRRPWRYLTLECITSVENFFTRMWFAVVRVAILEVFFILLICPISLTTLSTWDLAVDDTVDGKDNKMEKTREEVSHQLNFFQIEPVMLWWYWLTWKFFLYF